MGKPRTKSKKKTNQYEKEENFTQSEKKGNRKDHKTTYDGVEDKAERTINDASWYIPDEMIRKQVGSFSMSGINGIPTDLAANVDGTFYPNGEYVVPSVMGIRFSPCPGVTTTYSGGNVNLNGQEAPCNVAARRLYSAISAENSKTTQYQPQDLLFALLSIGELQSLVSLAYKLYGIAFTYNDRNRTVPRLLIKAAGCDPDKLLDNLTDFRMKLNVLLVAANEIRFPSNVKWFTKCWDLFSSYYVDAVSGLAQYYVPTIGSYWLLDETGGSGSVMKTQYIGGTAGIVWEPNDLLQAISDIISALLTSTTMNYVYADVLNYIAKRGGEMITFGYLPETYVIPPIYNFEMLTMIHNMDIVGYMNGVQSTTITPDNDVIQDPSKNLVLYNPQITSSDDHDFMRNHSGMLDFQYTDDPSADQKIEACIFKAHAAYAHNNSGTIEYSEFILPDHYVNEIRIWTTETDSVHFLTNTITWGAAETLAQMESIVKQLEVNEYFTSAPILYLYSKSTGGLKGLASQLSFYDKIGSTQLARMFNYALLGLLDFHTTSNRNRK